jgi:arylformamidase
VWFDLTRPVFGGMPVFPGDPEFTSEELTGEGFRISRLSLGSHTGTHVDAPAHVHPDGLTLDRVPLEAFAGVARVLDVRGSTEISPAQVLAAAGSRIVLLHTGNDEAHLSLEAAEFLHAHGTTTVGIDARSVDPPGSLAVHRVLLRGPGLVVENLTGLDRLGEHVEFFAFGWPVRGGDGSPVRAVARSV